MCKHEFNGKKEFRMSSGIVSVIYECNKCFEEFELVIGEAYPPNENGEFEY